MIYAQRSEEGKGEKGWEVVGYRAEIYGESSLGMDFLISSLVCLQSSHSYSPGDRLFPFLY